MKIFEIDTAPDLLGDALGDVLAGAAKTVVTKAEAKSPRQKLTYYQTFGPILGFWVPFTFVLTGAIMGYTAANGLALYDYSDRESGRIYSWDDAGYSCEYTDSTASAAPATRTTRCPRRSCRPWPATA